MAKILATLAGALLTAAAAIAAVPAAAEAQCHWGCTCEGNACGCNRNGSGSKCDNGGTGCVVTGCNVEMTLLEFAPDGSIARFASRAADADAAEPVREAKAAATPEGLVQEIGGSFRWESLEEGRSVARHCSGLILGRYYDRRTAAALREETRTLSI